VLGCEPVYFGIAVPTATRNPQVISAFANRLFKIVHMRISLCLAAIQALVVKESQRRWTFEEPRALMPLWSRGTSPEVLIWPVFPSTFKEGSNSGGLPNSSSDQIRTRPKRKSLKRRISSRRQPAKANEKLAG
jgi:hypothetical protein